MWTWKQQSGELTHNGEHVAFGYSGAPSARNDPSQQQIHDVGPIPQGVYAIGPPQAMTEKHGPFVLALIPDGSNEMFGRAAFLVHGESRSKPGAASKGCIILDRATRGRITASGDTQLTVIA